MVVDFFRLTKAPRKGLVAVEWATLAYVLFTSLLIFLLFGRMDHPGRMLLERGAIVLTTLAMPWLYGKFPCKAMFFLRVAFQLGLLSYWYPDTYEFNRCFPNLDHVFASIEQFVFGGQPALWFSNGFPHLLVSEAFNLGYFFYYPMMLIVMVYFCMFRFEEFDKASFLLIGSFFVYYFVYIFLPVAGPQFYFPAVGVEQVMAGSFPAVGDYFHHHQTLLPGPGYQHGFFYELVEHSQQVGERPTAAFPSSHVGISTLLMVMSWKADKRLFYGLAPLYMLLCAATVYIQAHYAIDSVVGFFSGIGLYWLMERFYDRRLALRG